MAHTVAAAKPLRAESQSNDGRPRHRAADHRRTFSRPEAALSRRSHRAADEAPRPRGDLQSDQHRVGRTPRDRPVRRHRGAGPRSAEPRGHERHVHRAARPLGPESWNRISPSSGIADRVTLRITSAFLWSKRDLASRSRRPAAGLAVAGVLQPAVFVLRRARGGNAGVDPADRRARPAGSTLVIESDERFDFAQPDRRQHGGVGHPRLSTGPGRHLAAGKRVNQTMRRTYCLRIVIGRGSQSKGRRSCGINWCVGWLLCLRLVCVGGWSGGSRRPRRIAWRTRRGIWNGSTCQNGDRTVKCFVAYPEVPNKAHAVIVIHEIFGLTDWVRGVADQLAEAGYIAIAPDLLSGMGPNGGGSDALGGRDGVRGVIGKSAARSDHGRPQRGGQVRDRTAGRQRHGVGERLLLGRRPVVPLRDQQQRSQGRVRLLWLAARQRRRDRADQLPGLRLLRRERRPHQLDDSQDRRDDEGRRQDFRTGDLQGRGPRLHARRRTVDRRQRSESQGPQRRPGSAGRRFSPDCDRIRSAVSISRVRATSSSGSACRAGRCR